MHTKKRTCRGEAKQRRREGDREQGVRLYDQHSLHDITRVESRAQLQHHMAIAYQLESLCDVRAGQLKKILFVKFFEYKRLNLREIVQH